MAARPCDFKSGLPDDLNGKAIRPADLHATMFKSMGLQYDHISNQSPEIVAALLK